MNVPEQSSEQRQFTIGSLFFWTAFVASCMLLYVHPSSLTFLLVPALLILTLIFTRRSTIFATFLMAIVWFCSFVLFQTVDDYRASEINGKCKSNVRLIAYALHEYESEYGCFPPAFTVDDEGNPLHSWRTLILPFLDEAERYESVDLTLPWDHPKNAKLLLPTPSFFRCSIREKKSRRDDGTTDYVGVVGEETLWKTSGKGTKLLDVDDSSQQKMMVIEMGQNRVPWMSPADMTYEQFVQRLQSMNAEGGVLDSHNGYCNCAYCDSNVGELTLQSDIGELISSLDINGE